MSGTPSLPPSLPSFLPHSLTLSHTSDSSPVLSSLSPSLPPSLPPSPPPTGTPAPLPQTHLPSLPHPLQHRPRPLRKGSQRNPLRHLPTRPNGSRRQCRSPGSPPWRRRGKPSFPPSLPPFPYIHLGRLPGTDTSLTSLPLSLPPSLLPHLRRTSFPTHCEVLVPCICRGWKKQASWPVLACTAPCSTSRNIKFTILHIPLGYPTSRSMTLLPSSPPSLLPSLPPSLRTCALSSLAHPPTLPPFLLPSLRTPPPPGPPAASFDGSSGPS